MLVLHILAMSKSGWHGPQKDEAKSFKTFSFRCEVKWKGINKLVCGRIVALRALNFLIAVGGWLTDGRQLAI